MSVDAGSNMPLITNQNYRQLLEHKINYAVNMEREEKHTGNKSNSNTDQ